MIIFFVTITIIFFFAIVVAILLKLNSYESKLDSLIEKFDEMDQLDEYFIATGISSNDVSK